MPQIAFDTLEYFEKLKNAGVPEEQAKVQAETFRAHGESQSAAISRIIEEKEKELATTGDLRETELCLQKEIRETELRLQKEIRETELRLQKEIRETELNLQREVEKVKYDLLKWQIGGWIALAAIMAKGFGWLGF